jgi:hypothetical protein
VSPGKSSSANVFVRLPRLLPAVPAALLLALAALVRLHGRLPYPDSRYAVGDHERYMAITLQPWGSPGPLAHQPPFSWRVLTPWLVHALHVVGGFSIRDAFWLITLAGLLGATVGLQWFLRGLGLSQRATVAGALPSCCWGPQPVSASGTTW